MVKKGWIYVLVFVFPALFFSCASKSYVYSDYRALPPKVKIKREYPDREKIVVITPEEKNYLNRESRKLNVRIDKDRDIRRFIYFYAVTHKKYTQKVFERAYLYLPLIKKVFREEGLPEELALLPFIESGFNPYATSSSGAAGLWQFLKGTGERFGLKINRYVDERRDIYKSTVAAARYLKHLYKMFGRWDLAISAYNCGEGCILSKIKDSRENFWDIKYRLPQQTREYFPRFLAVLMIAKNPGKYGIYPKKRTVHIRKKTAKNSISLRKLSYIYDIDYDLLKLYNAHFRKGVVLRGYNVYLPVSSSPPVVKVSYRISYIKHIVKKGETLYRISKKYNIPVEEIRRINNIKGNQIKAGQVLKIPKKKVAYRYDIQ